MATTQYSVDVTINTTDGTEDNMTTESSYEVDRLSRDVRGPERDVPRQHVHHRR